jgi:hypothetical protein
MPRPYAAFMRTTKHPGIRALFALFFSACLQAGTLAIDFTAPTIDYTNNQWSLGFEFNVLNQVTVTSLGFYDDQKNDLRESHDVGIFSSSGALLISGRVDPGARLESWFRWVDVAPTVLAAGNGYRIAAVTGSENYTWFPTNFTTDPNIQFVANQYTQSSTLVLPVSSSGELGWFGPNFAMGDAVPEPSTYALAGLALAALGLRQRYFAK